MRHPKTLTLLVVTALISIRAPSANAAEKKWLEVRSSHFRVVTDLSAKRGTEVARRCEQMRTIFALLMKRANVHDPAPLVIFALNGQNEVDEMLGNGGAVKHAGLFLPGSDEGFILVDASGDPWHAVYHEYAHELLDANTSSSVQTWFEEGFSEYFSTLEAGAKATKLGLVPLPELQFLGENGKLMRMADLTAVQQDSEIYNQNGPAQAMFYAESWLLVHYLFDHQLISRTEPFFLMMASGKSLSDASEAQFRMPLRHLETELLEYAKGERFRYFSLPAVETQADVTVRRLNSRSIGAWESDVRWHTKTQHSIEEAAAYVAEMRLLMNEEPTNARVLRQMGLALFELGKYEEAVDVLRRAVDSEPEEISNHYALSQALLASAGNRQDAKVDVAVDRELGACIHLDPNFADVYRLQALELSRRGLLVQAANLIQKALSLAPRNEAYKLALADLELRQHDYAPALALLQELKTSHNTDIAKQAEYFLSGEVAPSVITK
jgi:tetratricopeptide (TPR) repeat protein